MARSNGHCMTMGIASTIASMAEALGMQLPYSAAQHWSTPAGMGPRSLQPSW